MRVILRDGAVDAARDAPWELIALLGFACTGQHVVLFDPPTVRQRCLGLLDAQTRLSYAQALDQAVREAGRLPGDVATLQVDCVESPELEGPVPVLPLALALRVLREPLGILVENADNDWSFLLGVLRVVLRAPELSRIDRAVKERWAVPLHGGGDTLGARLNARLEDVATRLRTFVMFDSDRLHPEEFAPSWTPERPGQRPVACEAFHWELRAQAALPDRYWRLQRRFIESYMPKDELPHGAARGTHADAVEAFLRMNRDQRWHFNMKKGFQGDSRRDDWERCRDLYDSLNERPEDRRALEKGFGGTLADHYQEALTRSFAWDTEAQEEVSEVKRKLLGLL